MLTEDNKLLIREMFNEIWNKRQITVIPTFYAPTQVESTTAFVSTYFAGFADWHVEIVEMMSEGDQVMCRWRNSGTHHGEFLGIPPTGKRVILEGMSIQRIANGKIIDDAGYFDLLDLRQQLSGEGTE